MLEKVLRFSKRNVLYAAVILWLVSVNVWFYDYRKSEAAGYIYDDEFRVHDNKHKTVKIDALHDSTIKSIVKNLDIKDQRSIDSHSTVYDNILTNHNFANLIHDLSFKERCDLYFKNLFIQDRNWNLDPNVDLPLDHRYEFSFDDFKGNSRNRMKENYAKEKGKDVKEIDFNEPKLKELIDRMVQEDYDLFWLKNTNIEQTMTDYVSHLRIFNKCYVTNDNKFQQEQILKFITNERSSIPQDSNDGKFKLTEEEHLVMNADSCTDLESRIYKWLSGSFPIYERWTGEIYTSPPDYSKFVNHPEVFKSTTPKWDSTSKSSNECFLNKFKNSFNAKGIVLSIKDSHAEATVRLIHLLRALGNHYPIQIVYYDNVNEATKEKIINAARRKMIDLPESFHKVSHLFPKDYFETQYGGLPKQEVWFVNTYNAIHNNYKDKFRKFANKFLATLFNSFSEFMLIDADTVLIQNPSFFFDLENYKTKGAYFYRDRTAPEFRPISDGKLFEKISPSIIDNIMFDIPIVTRKTLDLEFFQGMGHYMESGLVVINKNHHFNSILAMLQLNFFHPVTTRLHGDKEIFWLGFAINGDEDYHFNKYAAAAIGKETADSERLNEDGLKKKSREICSAHPGHISGEDGKSLLWFNSGFQFCGQTHRVNYKQEFKHGDKLKFLKSVDEMKALYESVLDIRQAIIPPFKNKLETWADNDIGEPKQGWHMETNYCKSYLWCAYSSIGGTTKDGEDTTQLGTIFEFGQQEQDLFKYYGDIWIGNE